MSSRELGAWQVPCRKLLQSPKGVPKLANLIADIDCPSPQRRRTLVSWSMVVSPELSVCQLSMTGWCSNVEAQTWDCVLFTKEILDISPPTSSKSTNRFRVGFNHDRGTWYLGKKQISILVYSQVTSGIISCMALTMQSGFAGWEVLYVSCTIVESVHHNPSDNFRVWNLQDTCKRHTFLLLAPSNIFLCFDHWSIPDPSPYSSYPKPVVRPLWVHQNKPCTNLMVVEHCWLMKLDSNRPLRCHLVNLDS